MTVHEMLATHPLVTRGATELVERCIGLLADCATTCTACADACLFEEGVDGLRRCIALTLDCADICAVTERVLTRRGHPDPELESSLLLACARACRRCAEECEAHAEHHEHCRLCAESCRRCLEACEQLVASHAV